MEIFYYLKQRWYNSETTGEQTTKGLGANQADNT